MIGEKKEGANWEGLGGGGVFILFPCILLIGEEKEGANWEGLGGGGGYLFCSPVYCL